MFADFDKKEMGAPGRQRKMDVWKMLVNLPRSVSRFSRSDSRFSRAQFGLNDSTIEPRKKEYASEANQ